MRPMFLMILGSVIGIPLSAAMAVFPEVVNLPLVLFAAGALLGKGYGVWEERSRRPTPPGGTER